MPRFLLAVLGLLGGGAAMLLTTGVLTSPPPASPPPTAQLCQSSGAKHLSPPLAETEACARFLTGIAGVPEVTGVELKILPQGVLSAVVTRSGTRGSPSDYTLAVSDRAMTPEDLNRLAATVAAALHPDAPRQPTNSVR